jgi:hypothetical protein
VTKSTPSSHRERNPFRLKTLIAPNRNVRQNLPQLRCSKMPKNKNNILGPLQNYIQFIFGYCVNCIIGMPQKIDKKAIIWHE